MASSNATRTSGSPLRGTADAAPLRCIVALAAAFQLSGCAAASRVPDERAPAAATLAADAARIPLERYAGRLRAVRVRAAGRDWRLLFDTGGGVTLVSPALAQAMGCTPRGSFTGHRMSGETITMPTCAPAVLTIGGWTAPAQTLGIFDLMTLLPRDLPQLDGVVSLRSFAGRLVTLDLSANELVVHDRATDTRAAAGADARRLTGRVATGASGGELLVFAGVAVGGDTLWLEVDSGNLAGVQLAPHAARLLGVADSVGAEHPELTLPLVPGQPTTVRARVRSMILDGALDAAWLEQGRLTMDLAVGGLWWLPRAASR